MSINNLLLHSINYYSLDVSFFVIKSVISTYYCKYILKKFNCKIRLVLDAFMFFSKKEYLYSNNSNK
jgi:hypothetical protein